jgi:hypothetical protein
MFQKTRGGNSMSYVGFDLDGTLARYERGQNYDPAEIGEPIPAMVNVLKNHLSAGDICKIFTARVSEDPDGIARRAIHEWVIKHVGVPLEITCIKDWHMGSFYDDRAIQVQPNTGHFVIAQRADFEMCLRAVIGTENQVCIMCAQDHTDDFYTLGHHTSGSPRIVHRQYKMSPIQDAWLCPDCKATMDEIDQQIELEKEHPEEVVRIPLEELMTSYSDD